MRFSLSTVCVLVMLVSGVARAAPLAAVDCTAESARCPELAIAGDRPAATASHGYADPTIRKDPASRRIWMAYSWPHTSTAAGRAATAVDSHLAHSDDGGASWRFDGAIWTSSPTRDPVGGGPAFANSEAVSLAPARTAAGVRWFSARDRYVIGTGGRFRASTYSLRVAVASSPRALGRAPDVEPGLEGLAPELRGCVFRDPGLLFERGDLYLAVQCSRFTASGEDFASDFVAVFSTRPAGSVQRWTWRYRGRLAGREDAVALGGDALLQTELTRSRTGRLLAVFSPSGDAPGAGLAAHFGCRVVEVESLERPRLARKADGSLRVVADVRASDLLPSGPGACSYEPAAQGGIVIVRRMLEGRSVQVSLHRSGLRP